MTASMSAGATRAERRACRATMAMVSMRPNSSGSQLLASMPRTRSTVAPSSVPGAFRLGMRARSAHSPMEITLPIKLEMPINL